MKLSTATLKVMSPFFPAVQCLPSHPNQIPPIPAVHGHFLHQSLWKLYKAISSSPYMPFFSMFFRSNLFLLHFTFNFVIRSPDSALHYKLGEPFENKEKKRKEKQTILDIRMSSMQPMLISLAHGPTQISIPTFTSTQHLPVFGLRIYHSVLETFTCMKLSDFFCSR